MHHKKFLNVKEVEQAGHENFERLTKENRWFHFKKKLKELPNTRALQDQRVLLGKVSIK